MKIKIGDYEVYANGTIVSLPDESVKFLIEDLTYELVFKDDIEVSEQKVEAKESEDKKGVTLTFTNFNSSFGTSNVKPLPLGFINDNDLFLNYRILALNGGSDKPKTGKTIHYTWLLRKKEGQNG